MHILDILLWCALLLTITIIVAICWATIKTIKQRKHTIDTDQTANMRAAALKHQDRAHKPNTGPNRQIKAEPPKDDGPAI